MFHDELTVDVLTVAPWSGPHAIGFFGKSDRHIGHWSDVLVSQFQRSLKGFFLKHFWTFPVSWTFPFHYF